MNEGIVSSLKRSINCKNKTGKYYKVKTKKLSKRTNKQSWKCKIKLLKYKRIGGKNCILDTIEERRKDAEDNTKNSNIIYHREIKRF